LLLVRFLSTPARGTVQATAQIETQSTLPSFDSAPVSVIGTYASFRVPKALHRLPNESIAAPVLESFSFDYLANSRWRLSISIQPTTSNPNGYDSSYQFRLTHPDQYSESTIAVDGHTFRVMTDTQSGGFAKVAYLTDGAHAAAISLQGDAASDVPNLEKTFIAVLSLWQWR
jgi:hypothetical protein